MREPDAGEIEERRGRERVLDGQTEVQQQRRQMPQSTAPLFSCFTRSHIYFHGDIHEQII